MTKNPTKFYSTKQEQMIADYLGWSATPASGARLFNPGDVKSSDWLAECKTHTESKDKIVIKKDWWIKLANEAKGVMKTPILCVDNGTQRLINTWVVIPKYCYSGDYNKVEGLGCIDSPKSFSFSHSRALALFNNTGVYELSINNESLLLMKIQCFKSKFFDEVG